MSKMTMRENPSKSGADASSSTAQRARSTPKRRAVSACVPTEIADSETLVSEMMALVESVAFQRLDQRLAARLLGHGPVLRLTHQQLADELGSAREIVSRVLGQFADEGLIRSGRQEIEILDAPRLRERVAG